MSNPMRDRNLDYVILDGQRSPGIAEVTGGDSPRRWDERNGFGLSGARAIYHGTQLSKPKLVLRLLTAEHFDAWNEWRGLLAAPASGERAHPMEIEHPFLEDLGIRAVNIKNVKQPVQTGHGEWTVEIEMIEYREPTPALSEPRGASNGPQLSASDLEIARLSSEREQLDFARPPPRGL